MQKSPVGSGGFQIGESVDRGTGGSLQDRDPDGHSQIQRAKLLQCLGLLVRGGGGAGHPGQRGAAIGIDAEVSQAAAAPFPSRGTGEPEGPPVRIDGDLYARGIFEVSRLERDGRRPDLATLEPLDRTGHRFSRKKGRVALDVDDDVKLQEVRPGSELVDPVGPAGMAGGGERSVEARPLHHRRDLRRVGRDDQTVGEYIVVNPPPQAPPPFTGTYANIALEINAGTAGCKR